MFIYAWNERWNERGVVRVYLRRAEEEEFTTARSWAALCCVVRECVIPSVSRNARNDHGINLPGEAFRRVMRKTVGNGG